MHDTPSGEVDIVGFEVMGYEFRAISAGPLFKFNPSISIMVNFDPAQDKEARERIDKIWEQLSRGGKPLMPLDKYPFSERYGWIQDRYGVSWQIVPENMSELMSKNPEETTPAMLQMKKIIIADLETAGKE